MTVYSTTINTSAPDAQGNVTSSLVSERFNEGQYFTSEDRPINGPSAIDGKTGAIKAISRSQDLNPDDIIEVDGLQMTVKQAREAGVYVDVSGSESREATNNVSPKAPSKEAPEPEFKLEDQYSTDGERITLDTMVEAVAFHTNLDKEAAIELGVDIALGDLADDDPIWPSLAERGVERDSLRGSVENAIKVSQNAAKRELGTDAYNELTNLANGSRAIREMVVQHGIKRMNGQAKMGWGDVLQLARRFART